MLLWLILWAQVARAEVRLAFLELRNFRGELVQLEPNGRFAHIAISYGDLWLHAHPRTGVAFVSDEGLKQFGAVKEILTLSAVPDLKPADVTRFLGKPYDFAFTWSDDAIYCSELVAKLIGMEPEPMEFRGAFWNDKRMPRGSAGLSPDDIFRRLRPLGSCSSAFHQLAE